MEHRTAIFAIHCTPEERETIRVASSLSGKTMSDWMRELIVDAATALLKDRGVKLKKGEGAAPKTKIRKKKGD
jgi:uncharacterized protein (DUF1778 family)